MSTKYSKSRREEALKKVLPLCCAVAVIGGIIGISYLSSSNNVQATANAEVYEPADVTSTVDEPVEPVEPEIEIPKPAPNDYIRCTTYCIDGITRSGQQTTEGGIAGREEWLGMSCYLYSVSDDGSYGELIGQYTFNDTGYGVDGSMINGASVCVWCPTLDDCNAWISEYGDYVYMVME